MALASGQSKVKVTSYNTLTFNWEAISQDSSANTTLVSWVMTLGASTNGYINSYATKDWAVTVDGNTYSGKNTVGIQEGTTITLASGQTTVKHNTDGTKTFSYTFSQDFNINFGSSYIGAKSGSGSGVLPTIPKPAAITNTPSTFTDEANPTIKYSNKAGSTATVLEACISLTGANPDVPYRALDKNGNTYTFNLTDAERATLRRAAINTKALSVRFYVHSVIGGVHYYKYRNSTMTIVNDTPEFTITSCHNINEELNGLTGDESIIIRGYNTVEAQIGVVAKKEATITDYSISSSNGTVSNQNYATFENLTTPTIIYAAKDTRGNTIKKTMQMEMVDYIDLTCNITSASLTTDGVLSCDISGNFFNDTFGATLNRLTVQYRVQRVGENFSSWTTLTPVLDGNSYNAGFTLTGKVYTDTYIIEVRAHDTLMYAISAANKTASVTVNSIPIFDWGEEDFNFNVPVTINGVGITEHVQTELGLDDYIIASGTTSMGSNGTWYWCKWKSGKAEAWGSRNYGNMAVNQAWGSLYRSQAFRQTYPSVLFSIEYKSVVMKQSSHGGWTAWLGDHNTMSDTSPDGEFGMFAVVSPVSITMQQVRLDFHYIGRWK